MEVSRIRALRGPNLWSHHTAIEAIVTCQDNELNIAQLNGFETRLRVLFPNVGTLPPTGYYGVVSLAHVLEQVALSLQTCAGCPVTFSRTTPTPLPHVFQVVVAYSEEAVGRLAFSLAEKLCHSALHHQPFDLEKALHTLRELDEDVRLGPSTNSIVQAAISRHIPYRRLTNGSLVKFGWGSKQRYIQAAEIDCTSAIAEAIAQDKQLTKKLLNAAGVPVPLGRLAKSAEDAWKAALEIGMPVVVKPQDGNQGKGVTVNITTQEALTAAYQAAMEYSTTVIVENYLPGNDYRLLVVGNKLVAAARRDPPQVVGDGIKTIQALVDQINQDPKRGSGHTMSLTKIPIDDIALATLSAQQFTPDSIPLRGQRVKLRNNANLSTGGSATDVTDDVHPDIAAQVIAAAQMIGLDVCGVDLICDSVLTPLEAQRGGIVEVNAAPGLRMHLTPSFGKGRAVGEAIISTLFEEGNNGRIPVIAVTGTNGKTTTVRLIAHILAQTGLRVGMTNTDGIYIEGRRIEGGDCSGPRSARNVLLHPDVDAAVFETARGGLLREGLAFDCCQVAVVTNIGQGDHLGLNYITTLEDLAILKRVVVQNVSSTGMAVLNASDPVVANMAKNCPGAVTFFALNRHEALIATHRAQGQRVIYTENNRLVAAEGECEYHISLDDIPITHQGKIIFQIENVMAAVGAAWGIGVDWAIIETSLRSFTNNHQQAPARFNMFTHQDATIIADYGHNPDAMLALVQAVESLPAKRRIVVISAAGDRRDEDIIHQTRILGEAFDEVILYEDQCQRGRADGEVLLLLRNGLQQASRTQCVTEIQGELLAIDCALQKLSPGDVCLILVDQVEEALNHLAQIMAVQ